MCREGEVMEEKPTLIEKREKKIKETMLDDAFKKAEIRRSLRLPDKDSEKKSYKKTFPKFGFVLIVCAIIVFIVVNYVPWAYIEYGPETELTTVTIYKDFKIENSENLQIYDLFQSPHYLGLSIGDFSEAATLEFYGFILLIALGILITIFGILDKMRNFSGEIFAIIHFVAGTAAIIPGMFIVLSVTKFLSAQFLPHHNIFPGGYANIALLFPAAFILIIVGFVIIKLAFTMMKIDFNKIQETKEDEVFEETFSSTVYRGETR